MRAVEAVLAMLVSVASGIRPPSIVLLLLDDMDLMLGSMDALPSTRKLLGEQGT
jgi:hypothetical protein